ncbi:MAG TPA: GtrA family protein [Burkholderiales bacterium]|nr:GtrA family protein [Burkholderiales bacterium]
MLLERGRCAAWAANGVAFTAATLTSYWLNSIWTFEAPLAVGSLSRFASVAAIGLMVTVALTSAIAAAGYHYLVGIAAVVAIVPAMSFVLHRLWTYRVRSRAKSRHA